MEESTRQAKGKAVKLKEATVERLDRLKHKGQSYDGIVDELIDSYEEKTSVGQQS